MRKGEMPAFPPVSPSMARLPSELVLLPAALISSIPSLSLTGGHFRRSSSVLSQEAGSQAHAQGNQKHRAHRCSKLSPAEPYTWSVIPPTDQHSRFLEGNSQAANVSPVRGRKQPLKAAVLTLLVSQKAAAAFCSSGFSSPGLQQELHYKAKFRGAHYLVVARSRRAYPGTPMKLSVISSKRSLAGCRSLRARDILRHSWRASD